MPTWDDIRFLTVSDWAALGLLAFAGLIILAGLATCCNLGSRR